MVNQSLPKNAGPTEDTSKAAYEAKVGHTIGGSQIYRVLHRHGWHKEMPRSKHPNKASEEVIKSLTGRDWILSIV